MPQTNVPSPMSARRRLAREAGKLLPAIVLFVAIVGGYVAMSRRASAAAEAVATLPDVGLASTACSLWFVGSSTIYKWRTLREDMAPWDAHRRGINGAVLPQIVHRFENEPAGPAPAAIVVYAGENDIAEGATGAEAFARFQAFMDAKTRRFGRLPVVAISLKPSPARWSNLADQDAFNAALRRYAADRPDLGFVDIRPLMLRAGRPGPFYDPDGIHMNPAGYARWMRMLQDALPRMLPAASVRRCVVGAGA